MTGRINKMSFYRAGIRLYCDPGTPCRMVKLWCPKFECFPTVQISFIFLGPAKKILHPLSLVVVHPMTARIPGESRMMDWMLVIASWIGC